jgi:hypothetical protein
MCSFQFNDVDYLQLTVIKVTHSSDYIGIVSQNKGIYGHNKRCGNKLG